MGTQEIFDEEFYIYCVAKDKHIFLDALLSNRSFATNNLIASLLQYAIIFDSLKCYEVLLSYGAYLSDEHISQTIFVNGNIAKDRDCAIFYEEDRMLAAIDLDKPQIVIAILNENPQAINQDHLKYALAEDKIKTFRYMLTRCDDVNYSKLLSQAIKKEDINFVKIILQSRVKPTAQDLNEAITRDKYDIVKLLVANESKSNEDTLNIAAKSARNYIGAILKVTSITPEEYQLFRQIAHYEDFNDEIVHRLIPHTQSWHLTAISTNGDLDLFKSFIREVLQLNMHSLILQRWLKAIVKYECLNLLNVIETYMSPKRLLIPL